MSPPTNFTPGILVGDQQIAGRTVPACLVENHHTPVVDVDHQGQLLLPHLALAFEALAEPSVGVRVEEERVPGWLLAESGNVHRSVHPFKTATQPSRPGR